MMLPVTINGRVEQLDTLIVRPVVGSRFPLALIVNGSSRDPRHLYADGLAHLAHDFAHRGWLVTSIMWRGYGKSSGEVQSNIAGTCSTPNVAQFLRTYANDLAAALATLHRRPDVDPHMVLGVGISIGGVSMLELASRPGRPLTAVINISGGLYHHAGAAKDPACAPFEADLVRQISSFGAAGVPSLWLYAENDSHFGPQLVDKLLRGYRAAGGRADLAMLPPLGTDGHTLYRQDASALLQPRIDEFLRANRLPAMEEATAFAPLLASLTPQDRDSVERYLLAPTEKALAITEDGRGAYWHYGARSLEEARRLALAHCQSTTSKQCRLIADNRTLITTWRDEVSRLNNR